MVEWIIGAVVVAGLAYFGYKVVKGESVAVGSLDVNNDGKLDKADASAAVEKVAEKAKKNVAKATDKAAAKVKKNVDKAVDKTVKKAGRPKKTA